MIVTFLLPMHLRFPIGGYAVVYRMADELVGRGHRVSIVQPRVPSDLSDRSRSDPLRGPAALARAVLSLPRSIPWQLSPAVDLRVPLRLDAAAVPSSDVVVATAHSTVPTAVASTTRRGRAVWLVQGWETWSGQEEKFLERLRSPIPKAAIATWLCEAIAEAGDGALPPTHIPLAVDTEVFRVVRDPSDRSASVAMLYHPRAEKGGAEGIAALEAAKEQVPELRAYLFGVRPRPRHLPAWMSYWRRPPRDVLARDIYNQAAIYLCPSRSEGWHLPPAEAMASGSAVVTTDIPGVGDYATADTAQLVPVGDPDEMTAAVVALLQDPDRRIGLAWAGHRRIQAFNWEATVAALERWLAPT